MYQPLIYSATEAVDAQDERRSRIDQIRENSARSALVDCRFSTVGQGSFLMEDVIPFGLSFVNGKREGVDGIVRPLVPSVQYGFSLPVERSLEWHDQDHDISLSDPNEIVDEVIPRATGGVWRWQTDRNGLYIGAFLFCTVSYDEDVDYEIEHYYTFYGTALKGLPGSVAEEVRGGV